MQKTSKLFFSNQCEASMRFITLLQDEKILNYFDMINIRDIRIPNVVTPTIILKNVQTYVGKDAFIWLEKIKEGKRISKLKDQENKMSKYFGGATDSGLLNYNREELSNSSDTFAYCNNDDNVPLPGRYVNATMVGNDSIIISGLQNMKNMKIDRNKITDKTQKELLTKYTEDRNKQDKEIKRVYQKMIYDFNIK